MNLKVGKIRDAHGMNGEVFLISFPKDLTWLSRTAELKLEGQWPNPKGKHEPVRVSYKIKSYRAHKKGAIVRLEGVGDRTAAEKLIGFVAEMPLDLLQSKNGEEIFLTEIEGFEVFNGDELLGKIVGFSSNNAQDLIVVESGEKKIEIPLIPPFISEIKWSEKKLLMKLPPGLE